MGEQLAMDLRQPSCPECGLPEPHIPFAACLNPPDYAEWPPEGQAKIAIETQPDDRGRQRFTVYTWRYGRPRAQLFFSAPAPHIERLQKQGPLIIEEARHGAA